MKRLLLILAVVSAMFASSSGHAAATVMVLTDKSGDANMINSQGSPVLKALDANTPTLGAQFDALDIQNLKVTTEFAGGKPSFVVFTLGVAADPRWNDIPHKYMIKFKFSSCASNATHELVWDFGGPTVPGANTTALTHGPIFYRSSCADDAKDIKLPTSKISGKSLIFRVPANDIGKKGVVLSEFVAEGRLRHGAAYAATADYAFSNKKYTIGQ